MSLQGQMWFLDESACFCWYSDKSGQKDKQDGMNLYSVTLGFKEAAKFLDVVCFIHTTPGKVQ